MTKEKSRKDPQGRVLKTGEFYRNSDGLYIYRYTNEIGDRQQISAKTLKDLREKEKRIQRDLLDGIRTHDAMKTTLNMLFDGFIQRKSKKLRPNSVSNYNQIWDSCVRDRIGDMPVARIKTSTLNNLFSELADEGRAKSCINQARKHISSCLRVAVADDLIRKNPADYVEEIAGTVKKVSALTTKQQNTLIDYAESGVYFVHAPLLIFAIETGLRCGELCALQWSDIDDNYCYVHVTKQLQDIPSSDGKRERHIVELKTDAGNRDIKLTSEARRALTEQKKIYMKLGIRCSLSVDGLRDFVFLGMNGEPRNHNSIFTFLRRMIDSYNKTETEVAKKEGREPELMPRISAHVLRHTAITNWVNNGMSIKSAQYNAGHKHPNITADVYADSDRKKAGEEMISVSERRREA